MSGVSSVTRKHACAYYLVFVVLLVASANTVSEIAVAVEVDIPAYAEPAQISFPSPLPLPDLTQVSDNLELAPKTWICGAMFSYDSPPQPLATLSRVVQRYHHFKALLGLNPQTKIHVLKFNYEKKNLPKVVW